MLAMPREMTSSANSSFFAGVHGPPAAPPFLPDIEVFGLMSLPSAMLFEPPSVLTFLRGAAPFVGVMTRVEDGGEGAKSDEASRSGVDEREDDADRFIVP